MYKPFEGFLNPGEYIYFMYECTLHGTHKAHSEDSDLQHRQAMTLDSIWRLEAVTHRD